MIRARFDYRPEVMRWELRIASDEGARRLVGSLAEGSPIVGYTAGVDGAVTEPLLALSDDEAQALIEAVRAADDHRDVWRARYEELLVHHERAEGRVDRVLASVWPVRLREST